MIVQSENLNEKTIKMAHKSGDLEALRGQEINRRIREKYSASDELAIHRHYLNGKGESEFTEYNAYCEKCKAEVTDFIAATLGEVNNG